METVIRVLMLLVGFSFLLKLTFHKWYQTAIMTTCCIMTILLGWPVAIEQSKASVTEWLTDSSLRLDMAVLLTIDVILQLAYCLLSVHVMTSGTLSKRTVKIYKTLRWYPGTAIFPVLFLLLVSTVFSFPGHSFSLLAWLLAAAIGITIPVTSWLIRKALPEKDIRLELLFMANILTAVLGIIATVDGHTMANGTESVDYLTTLCVLTSVTAVSAAGYVIYRFRMNRTNKKDKHT